jgi:hypothetical protein
MVILPRWLPRVRHRAPRGCRLASVILVVFVLVAFIGIPVFLSWKRGRG